MYSHTIRQEEVGAPNRQAELDLYRAAVERTPPKNTIHGMYVVGLPWYSMTSAATTSPVADSISASAAQRDVLT